MRALRTTVQIIEGLRLLLVVDQIVFSQNHCPDYRRIKTNYLPYQLHHHPQNHCPDYRRIKTDTDTDTETETAQNHCPDYRRIKTLTLPAMER